MAQADQSAIYRRFRTLGESERAADDGKIAVIASTDQSVSMGGWREVLSHAPGAVDISSARSLLLNHDANLIVGGISGIRFENGQMNCDIAIDPDAKLMTGTQVLKSVRSGNLYGISIGYWYESKDAKYDEQTRTVTVDKWRLLEISLTPIQADPAAHVRSLPTGIQPNPAAPAAHERSIMDDKNKAAGENAANDETKRAQEIAALRERAEKSEREAVTAKRESKIRALATEHGVSIADLDFAGMKSDEEGITELLKRKAAKEETHTEQSVVTVARDGTDKFLEGVEKGLTGSRDGLFLSNEQIMRRCLTADGEKVDHLPIQDLANMSLRRMSYAGKRAAPNKTTSSFSALISNTANKQLLAGFDAYAAIYPMICTIKDAKDYNSHDHVGVAAGRLQETPEGQAFPELIQKEGTYSTQLKMFGATLNISEQTLVNDPLGEILKSFYRTGYVANRTIDRLAIYKLLNATWTNDLTTGAALGTAGNFDKARAGFKKKLGPAGEKMELEPKVLLVDPVNRYNAELVTGQLYGIVAGAGNSQLGSNAARSLTVFDSSFIGDTNLFSSALTTDYYLLGDPNIVDTIIVEFLNGQRVPEIEPFDAGAVAGVAMKVKLPMNATMATHSDGTNTRVTGAQKATVA